MSDMRKTLSEVLRPKEFDDLMQPSRIVSGLKRMAKDQQPLNMLFYGAPSVGKTTAARILLKELGDNSVTLNGSLDNGVDMVRDLQVASSNYGLGDGPRVFFIDEAEYLSVQAQAGLRVLIEKADTSRFVLAANDISKFHPALKSRCLPICFDISVNDADAVIGRLLPRYQLRLKAEGFQIHDKRLSELLHAYFPDLRAFSNAVEFEAGRPPT
jgi:replication-associated recombination protein RarA